MLMWSVGRIIDLLGEKIFFPREEKKTVAWTMALTTRRNGTAGVNLLTLI